MSVSSFLTIFPEPVKVDEPANRTETEALTLEETMTKADLDTYRRILVNLRTRLTGDVSHLAGEAFRTNGNGAGNGASSAPQHPADVGTDAFEQEFTLSLLENQEQAL